MGLCRSSLGSGPGGSECPPPWYYVGLEMPPRETAGLDQECPDFGMEVLSYTYWLLLGTFAFLALLSVALGLGRWLAALKGQAKPMVQPRGDPVEIQLVEVLHLLEAVMYKTQHYLHQKQRRRLRHHHHHHHHHDHQDWLRRPWGGPLLPLGSDLETKQGGRDYMTHTCTP
ncbi:hypothetical protein JRQ81_004595 [Phrynocephalus forsythii]|uniref:Uncharacterized protein n=1 Tax=Phrynocephalus forsythii TaxID=171643 RepID=A0A9Q0XFJ2_9SAUR|nr:hypothetical protein JRQ81_004595 [Phrynocephalus forsythii]